MSEMKWPFPEGTKMRTQFGNSLDKLYHVRGTVDGLSVVRHWRSGKQRWEYEVLGKSWWIAHKSVIEVEVPRG